MRTAYRGVGIAIFGVLLAGLILKFGWLSLEGPMKFIQADDPLYSMTGNHPKYTNIAIVSKFGAHFDVYMTVGWTIQHIKEHVDVTVYTQLPFPHDFQRIIDDYGIYNGPYRTLSDFLPDVTNKTGEGAIDMVIFGTCEIDLPHWGDELLSAWDARDAEHKFQLVCIVHDADDRSWQKRIPEWSRRVAIRLLPISSHVQETFRQMFMDQARSADPLIRSAGMEHIPVDVHVPILALQDQHVPLSSPSHHLSNAVIQGSFSAGRRDYPRIFSELNQSMHEDPYVWGYLPLVDSPSFLQDMTLANPPFQLHLVGNGGIEIPTELKNVVILHTNLNYADFYAVMGAMDICVPAFLATQNRNYRRQASSSIAMCMEVNVPILALRELRSSYSYIDDDRITVTRPAVMSEVEALKALRTGDASAFLESDPSGLGITLGSNAKVRNAVEAMMRAGWERSQQGFDVCKSKVWRENENVMRRVLRGL